jgi:hypothetical protein
MSLRGIVIKEGKIGANVAGDGREFGLIGNGVAVVGKLDLATHYVLRRPSDAIALGIDVDYDATSSVNAYRHITEFYRMAGEGKKLHLMLVAQTVMIDEMTDLAKTLALAADGAISDIVFCFNPAAGYTETLVDGMTADVMAAIPVLQAFADWADENDMPLHTILEGRGMGDTLAALADLRDPSTGSGTGCPKVTVIVGQDWDYAEGLGTLGKKFADVGTFLGVVASQAWNRNPGEVASQNLTNAPLNVWMTGGLSNHKKYIEVYDELETMNDKGYVFAMKYRGASGYWWNDGHVCAPIVLDSAGNMNQHMIYYSHTIDEAKRALRIAYLPEVKKPVMLENGLLPASMVGYYDALGDGVFDKLAGKELLSEGKTFTDPESDLLIEKILRIRFAVVPTGTVNEIVGTINLKNQ